MRGDRSSRRYSLLSIKLYQPEANNSVQQYVQRLNLVIDILHYAFQVWRFQFLAPADADVAVTVVSRTLVHEGYNGRIEELGRWPHSAAPLVPAP
jgi:hypothetical protein